DSKEWVWGLHAVEAALANPARGEARRLLASPERARKLGPHPALEVMEPGEIARVLPQGAVHQGLALKIDPPEPLSIEEIGADASGFLVMLDQVTDPQNVWAVFRSSAAFGAK